MTANNRLQFEAELLKELKLISSMLNGVVATKNKLKFKHNKKYVAELYFTHIQRSDAYILGGRVYGGDLYECMLNHTPPYKSNLFQDACFSFVTSGEQGRKFSGNMMGAIETPSPEKVGDVCGHIKSVLEKFYIPKILSCITPTEQTVDEVLMSPDNYAYPAVFISCAASLGSSFDYGEKIKKSIDSKRIIKNKSYDVPLLSGFL
ncbi:hypothetical protein G7Z99_14770 [Pseudomonas entomophila]|uniref:hypothetical protein n=1 Tax=Pseudomonas entomophila TaxID=312306 RepID=UPI0015E3F80F|nr:hypothetical protein [Pseudomonas entomophila]MBA1190298.1 hypothetical protein [Pseudomonas entomophila]